jgi:hypothetical protein
MPQGIKEAAAGHASVGQTKNADVHQPIRERSEVLAQRARL